ncbi:MAG: hypothetical protein IPM39_24780 [Chloroflexi bacterium]|nr:hypothetical protein [Chloroflexota bacterium]
MSQLSRREPRHTSLFGPIALISIGLFFLVNRLNPVTDLYWLDVLRLWPLLLIFLGVNVLALQAPRPYASLFSAGIGLAAVLLFGFVLLNGLSGTPFSSRVEMGDWQTKPIEFRANGVETAVYDLIIGPPGADLSALADSSDLIAGTITYQDDYLFDTRVTGSRASVRLAPQNQSEEWVFLPEYWQQYGESNRWQLGLNGSVPAALKLEAVAGRSLFDLRDLQLESLTLAANAGDVELLLPGGDYHADLATNAATMEITLPENGRHTITLDVNAGSVTLRLPPGMALRVELDRALGSFNANNAGLRQMDGQENVWQTAGYENAPDRVDLTIHISLGSVTLN